MQDEEWAHNPVEGQEVVEEFDLNVGGLVGAVAGIEGTGRLVTGTRNDESGLNAPASGSLGNRLTVHSIRDTQGRVLGLGPRQRDEREAAGGWEPVAEAWAAHEGAVTGIDVVVGYGNLGDVSGVVTSGGDGCLRLFELTIDSDNAGSDSEDPGASLYLQGEVAVHAGERAVGVAATRRRAITVGEDGMASVVDLQRLGRGGGAAGGAAGGGDGGSVVWRGKAKGALPLSGVTFKGESEEVFATAGCDPRGQLMIWDTRAKPGRPTATFGCLRGSGAPYLCVASQPFNPEVFACGVSTGELLLWDTRAGDVVHELKTDDRDPMAAGTWGAAFHPRRPRHLFSCTGTGVLTKWYLPPDGQMPPSGNASGGPRFGASEEESWVWRGGRNLHALPSRSALVGVCYDEGADTVSAVSKHGHVVVAQGVQGLRL